MGPFKARFGSVSFISDPVTFQQVEPTPDPWLEPPVADARGGGPGGGDPGGQGKFGQAGGQLGLPLLTKKERV